MEISSHELIAFRTLARILNFSAAAHQIHITQSALSQRIKSLENKFGLTLFVRDRKAIRLTDAGLRVLRYCQIKDHLEAELLHDLLDDNSGKLGGQLSIAGYSSVLHSVILPALAPLLRENPSIQFKFILRGMNELPEVLMRSEADFVVMDYEYQRNNVSSHILGYEKYLRIQSSQYPESGVYLDYDQDDKITQLYFEKQMIDHLSIKSSFVDDIHGILNGVVNGVGQGIVPCHLIQEKLPIRIVKGENPLYVPLVLHYFHQPYYSRLQKKTIEMLKINCEKYLLTRE